MNTAQYGHGPLAEHAQGPLMPAEPCTEIGADTDGPCDDNGMEMLGWLLCGVAGITSICASW